MLFNTKDDLTAMAADSLIATNILFSGFPKRRKAVYCAPLTNAMQNGYRQTCYAGCIEPMFEWQREEKIMALYNAKSNFNSVAMILQSYIDEPLGFLKHSKPDDNFATIDDIRKTIEIINNVVASLDDAIFCEKMSL